MRWKAVVCCILTAALAGASVAGCTRGEHREAEGKLSNPQADAAAQAVYAFLCEQQGKRIVSGQQESTWVEGPDYEMNYIFEQTGKLPAIRGLDFINDDFDGVVQRAIDWWNEGGLVSICWHWGAPPDGVGYESSMGEIDLKEGLKEGTALHEAILLQMSRAADALAQLQQAGVPVLWRPFHEFDGKWFWWGKGGKQGFIALWQWMYTYFTQERGLNNLIWVLGYSDKVRGRWYPGDAYVDIVGADDYGEGTRIRQFQKVSKMSDTGKPVCLHECGQIPDPDALKKDGADWVWFLTWHTKHIQEENTPEALREIYNHPYVVTRDELPRFQTDKNA